MEIKKRLLDFGKKTISINDLASLLQVNQSDTRELCSRVEKLQEEQLIAPIKSSGMNGNLTYRLYKKYRISVSEGKDEEVTARIRALHPMLQRGGYLAAHPQVFRDNEELIMKLNRFLFTQENREYISRKERSFEIFGREKILDDSSFRALLHNLQIGKEELKFYDTPEYCFHDYIPVRKEQMTLLICENKDIWFNIRRCMFENHFSSLFGVAIDGVVYGCGNKVSQKQGALAEYVKFMGNPYVKFLYWGDIDREGFDIFRRTREANRPLELTLFLPGYRRMIEKAQNTELEDSPSSKKEDMVFDDLFSDFSETERAFLQKVLKENKLIPQEIVSYSGLYER